MRKCLGRKFQIDLLADGCPKEMKSSNFVKILSGNLPVKTRLLWATADHLMAISGSADAHIWLLRQTLSKYTREDISSLSTSVNPADLDFGHSLQKIPKDS